VRLVAAGRADGFRRSCAWAGAGRSCLVSYKVEGRSGEGQKRERQVVWSWQRRPSRTAVRNLRKSRPRRLFRIETQSYKDFALRFAVAGLPLSAGTAASSGPGIGDELTTGLWGAEDGEQLFAYRGPVELQAGLTSEMTITLGFDCGIRCRVVGSLNFRLCLGAAQVCGLQFRRKRQDALRLRSVAP
jgi:hypothetical protein